MGIEVRVIKSADRQTWDDYVHAHPQATLYHLYGWKNIIKETYGHKTYYLMATKKELKAESSILNGKITGKLQLKSQDSNLKADLKYKANYRDSIEIKTPLKDGQLSAMRNGLDFNQVLGILPLIHVKHFLFGNSLISVPFCDYGGILAENREAEKTLFIEGIRLALHLNVNNIELRNINPDPQDFFLDAINSEHFTNRINLEIKSHKVRMLFQLPESSEVLLKSFKSKLRSQIKKPVKEGLVAKIGGIELLDDFYTVFCRNMRDLGSPVHSKKIMIKTLKRYSEKARAVVVYKENRPVACSIICGFRDTLENPWASSLKEYSKLSPNMLLYWTMLEYACDNGYKWFDFGRSSPDEGTFKFKKQWGTESIPLHWHYISLTGSDIEEPISRNSKFEMASRFWQKLPVSVTKIIGPPIRKNIGL